MRHLSTSWRLPRHALLRRVLHAFLGLETLLVLGCGNRETADAGGRLAASLEREIGVVEDMTVFTLFAFLNVAGYDLENRESGMHPVRVQVRAALAQDLDPELRAAARDFYARHLTNADPWSYSVVAMATSGPPAFEPTGEWTRELVQDPQFGALGELHELLRRFYSGANVPALYRTVQPAYQEYVRHYRAAILRETAAALDYCRLALLELTASGERQNPVVIPNLLDSYEHAFSFVLDNRFLSVEGPQQRIGYNPHEFVHDITNPAVYTPATAALRDRLLPVVEAATRALGEEERYTSVEAFVDECLVRAISLRYAAAGHHATAADLFSAMLAEYGSGFVLERFFWEQLAGYEREDVDLRQYYPQMLATLDAGAELQRWQRETSSDSVEIESTTP